MEEVSPIMIIFYAIIIVAGIAGMWKTFEKAGHPGWAAIVPIYNIYILTKVADKPAWYIALFFIPLVNFVAIILLYHGVSKNFGKGAGFTVGLVFLNFIFFPILGFGDAEYLGEGGSTYDDVLDS